MALICAVYANRCDHRLLSTAIALMREYPMDSAAVAVLRAGGNALPIDGNPVSCVLHTERTEQDMVIGLPGASLRWLNCNAYPMLDEDGSIPHVAACFTECTDLNRVEGSP